MNIDQIRSLVTSNVIGKKEQPDGFDFYFPHTQDLFQTLELFIANESQCCTFLDFELQETTKGETMVCEVRVNTYDLETAKEIIVTLFSE